MKRIPPSELLGQKARELAGDAKAEDLTSELIRMGARKLIQEALEAEVSERLGRERYQRADGESPGWRNGYKQRRIDCAEGRLEIDLPQVRGTDEPFSLELWEALKRRTDVLERLVIEMYAGGLSTRDIEDALREISQDGQALLSRSSVSRLTEVLWEEYEEFQGRDLSGFDIVYLFSDAVYESLRAQAGLKEGILVSWAILSCGAKVLLSMTLGNKESYEDWLSHYRDMVSRGLKPPLTVTTDGAPGLTKAAEAMWPKTERIRCWVHKMRNVLDKVPDDVRPVLKPWLEAVRDAPDYEAGKMMAQATIEKFSRDYPSAMKSFAEDLEASLVHLKLPSVHRKNIRTTNLVERSFVEERRRAKVIPRFRGERECLKLVFAVLWRASERWQRVRFTDIERKHLDRYIEMKRSEEEQRKRAESADLAGSA
jgi:transposase-like protein